MTIDERLERLKERQDRLLQRVQLAAETQRKNEGLHRKNQILLTRLSERVESLARITRLEDGQTL